MIRRTKPKEVSVTDAKAHFLELVRLVERGIVIDITKSGKKVARLTPPEDVMDTPLFGFAPAKILGSMELSGQEAEWSFDQANFKK